MANEIERKFLLRSDAWRALGNGTRYRQGYLSTAPERTVRIRVVADQGFLTVKGPSAGAVRAEYEYNIPLADANEMLERLCKRPIIAKIRYEISHEDLVWTVDEFEGVNEGLVIAEVELSDANQGILFPGWIGEEVTEDPRYFNANLISNPYCDWSEKNRL